MRSLRRDMPLYLGNRNGDTKVIHSGTMRTLVLKTGRTMNNHLTIKSSEKAVA